MRGRQDKDEFSLKISGNTPAYAGKTRRNDAEPDGRKKHPRVCGEDRHHELERLKARETPPRMRGRLLMPEAFATPMRNTPAYAGKTFSHFLLLLARWKHPRVCGEDANTVIKISPFMETPPRMRGRLLSLPERAVEGGNTPAYAGKTRRTSSPSGTQRKHPRVCGEDSAAMDETMCGQETPPRMRGRPAIRTARPRATRNTPAYAGKTLRTCSHVRVREKHPRVCGEDLIRGHDHGFMPETPPRMRGRPTGAAVRFCGIRNTPAYAGKTVMAWAAISRPEKHPRVCGEDRLPDRLLLSPRETPPRMRGRPQLPQL